jgi:hypothetical protein
MYLLHDRRGGNVDAGGAAGQVTGETVPQSSARDKSKTREQQKTEHDANGERADRDAKTA